MATTDRPALSLKLTESTIDPKNPWADDALDRKPLADALTNLIRNESSSLVLSLNGNWGSGKTFILKRWQVDLENQGFRSLYFNAWEDDFLADPLVAIVGQLWDALKGTDLEEIGNSLKEITKATITDIAFNLVRSGTAGVVDLDPENLKSTFEHIFDNYETHRANREELKKRLAQVASKITEEKTGPLVFIIDELDRCRPTFSVELLERLKHICAVPNIVFVLGIDRSQLGASIRSVYGEIDIEGYLQRFFDMEFSLPQPDRVKFAEQMLLRHDLQTYFANKSKNYDGHKKDFGDFRSFFPDLCEHYQLTLREIEQTTRVFVLVSRNLQDQYFLYPHLLAVLLILRIRKHQLYRDFLSGPGQAANVLDYLESFLHIQSAGTLWLEAMIYAADGIPYESENEIDKQLNLLNEGKAPTRPDLLSHRTKARSREEIVQLISKYASAKERRNGGISRQVLDYLSNLVELTTFSPKKRR